MIVWATSWLYALMVTTNERAEQPDLTAALVADAQNGDAHAFEALYRRHVQLVYARLTRLIGPSAEREDLVQQVFLELHRALPSFRGEAPFGAFLHGITVRVGYDYLRRRVRQKSRNAPSVAAKDLVSPGASPETEARERQELARAFARLDGLKPKKRVAFVLHVVEGLSLEDMSRMLGVDARTLGQRVAYARRELLAMMAREAHSQREDRVR